MMATLPKAQSRRLYSWWWDSHISPKNSKWLQENLSDMDMKVKAMLKLIEEDADSFARRAEMYYKKRPELVKLVEEFYRAYRALAERYDHATGELRQAHETMEEAFPNRISFATPDQPRSRSSASEPEPCTPEPTSSHTPFDPDESQKHSTGVPSMLHSSERHGAYTDEVDNLLGENGLKQLTEICATAGVEMHSEGSATKGLNFQEEEGKASKHKRPSRLKDLHKHAFIEEEYIGNEIKRLQEEVSQLAKENKELDEQIASETRRADEAETEVQSIKNILSKLNSEKEAACLQYQLSIEKLSNLEAELSRTNAEFWEHNDNMLMGVEKLKHADENSLLLEKANQSLKRELDTLNKRHHGIAEQMEAVGLHLDSLKVLFKELKNEKLVLQEIGKQYEDGRQHILEKLRNLENVREKNVVLENTLSDLHDELEESRKKIKALEEYCESLHAQIAVHATEKAEMVSQIEAMAWNREKLTEKNTFLENSLSDASTELDGMRGELQGLTESFQSLNDQNAIKLAEKNTLLVEMENIGQCLNNLERRHAELQEKCLFLEREKALVLLHVEELQDFLKIAKQEHENLIESSTIQLANLNYQMRQLQEEGQLREEEFGSEQQKFMNAEIEIFVLQRCLRDMKESNLVLSRECQVHMDALKCIENQKFHFEYEYLAQKQTVASLTERIGKLSEGIFGLLKELRKNTEFQLLGNMNDESLVQFLSHETKNLLTSLSDVQDENQHLMLDRLVLLTLLKQIGLDARCMGTEEDFLEKQLIVKNKELAQIKNEKQELMEMNKQLILDLQYSIHRQESFNEELKIACGELSDLREGHSILQGQNLNLLRDNQLMSVKFDELREAKENIKDENFLILSEVMTLECLSSIFRSICIERALELQSCNADFVALVDVENGLNQEIRLLNEKLRMVEVENSQLKQMVVSLDESRSRCTIPENGLTAVRNLTSISSEDNVDKGNEVVPLCQENAILNEELHKMRTELEQLKDREKHLTSKLQRGINEMKYCEAETAASLVEFQLARTKSELFEQKLLELILAFETLEIGGMLQKEILSKAISLRDAHQDELKEKLDAMEGENRELKAGIRAYMPLVMSLHHCIAALEQRILPLATQHAPNIEEKQVVIQDNMLEFHHLDKGNQEGREDPSVNMPVEILELQKLLSEMDALQNVVLESMRRLEDQKKEHWGLRSEDRSGQEVKTSSNVIQLEEREIPGLHLKLQEDDSEMCGENHGQIMKDIRLDCASSSTYRSDANSYGTEDQILEPWQTPVRDFSNPMEMEFSPPKEHDIRHHEIQETSILASDKQLGIIDKLAPTSKVPQLHQQWSSRVIEKLASYEDRLAVLQAGFEELKEQIEASDKRKYQASFSLGAIKLQVKESEGTIRALIDINNALKKKAGDFSACSSSVVKEQKESIDKSKRQISVWAQKVSEKIERLELEMHKIQYVLLKLEEEHEEYLARGAGRRRVVLKDYLYGRKNKQRDKRAYLSGCVKPKTDNK